MHKIVIDWKLVVSYIFYSTDLLLHTGDQNNISWLRQEQLRTLLSNSFAFEWSPLYGHKGSKKWNNLVQDYSTLLWTHNTEFENIHWLDITDKSVERATRQRSLKFRLR